MYTSTTPRQGTAHNGASYICILSHTSGALTEPLIGANWATYWEVLAEKGADGLGAGDMLKSTYDPTSINASAFNQDNMLSGVTNKNYTATEQSRLANTSGTNTGDQTTITGNAGTATALQTARTLNGVSFDGTANITVPTDLTATAGTTAGPTINSSSGTNVVIPSASETASGIVTTGTQTFAGAKTFSTIPTMGTISSTELGYLDGVTSAIQTQLNLKATKANPTFTGLIKEQVSVSTLTLGATSSVQTYTATANFTIVDDLESGESVVFYVTNAGYVPTYPTTTWDGGAEPTLGTTDRLFFEKVGSVLYGFHTATFV